MATASGAASPPTPIVLFSTTTTSWSTGSISVVVE